MHKLIVLVKFFCCFVEIKTVSHLYPFHHHQEGVQFQSDYHRQVDEQELALVILTASILFSTKTNSMETKAYAMGCGGQGQNMWGARNLQVYVLGDARVL